MKITKNKADFTDALIIASVCSLAGLPPPWGVIFFLLSMFLLIWKFTGAKVFPDCLLAVLLSWGVGFSGKFLIKYLAGQLP